MEGGLTSDTDPVVVSVGGSVGAAVVTVVGAAVDGEGLLPPPPRRADAVASIRKRQRNVFMAFLILTVKRTRMYALYKYYTLVSVVEKMRHKSGGSIWQK